MAARGTYRQIGSGGGVRQLQDVRTGRVYQEAGLGEFERGARNLPTGYTTYRAVRQTPPGASDGFITISVYGLRPASSGSPGLESGPAYVWRSIVRHKQELLDGLYDIRNDKTGGPNAEYLEILSAETGYDWLTIDTIRVTT